MAVSQSYIIGYPATVEPDRAGPGNLDRPRAVGQTETAPSGGRGDAGIRPVTGLSLPAWRARTSLLPWLSAYGHGLRALARSMPHLATVTVTFRSGMSFFDQVAPVLLLGRFFGTHVILRYRSSKAEAELEDYGRAMLPFLGLAGRIEVNCRHLADTFAAYGVKAAVEPERVDRTLFSPRRVTSVQPKIIMTRRLDRGNNPTAAIRAFQLVKMKYPRAELLVLGDGPQRPWLEQLVASERIFGVTFTGQVYHSEVARHMSEADIYLNSSAIDGLPVSLLEAFSAGLAVVTTDAGDIGSVATDERNALVAPVNDYVGLSDRIIRLVEQPELVAALSAHAAATAERFSGPSAQACT